MRWRFTTSDGTATDGDSRAGRGERRAGRRPRTQKPDEYRTEVGNHLWDNQRVQALLDALKSVQERKGHIPRLLFTTFVVAWEMERQRGEQPIGRTNAF